MTEEPRIARGPVTIGVKANYESGDIELVAVAAGEVLAADTFRESLHAMHAVDHLREIYPGAEVVHGKLPEH